ncbi:hypothetical protein L7F22_033450 [Adiantum nelumboides]|nr:hypothetical protein [Adiantum nelumboides]
MPPMQTARSIAPPSTVNLRQDHEVYQSYQAKPQGMAHGYLPSDHGAHWKPDQVPIQPTKMWNFGRAKAEIAEDLEEKHPLINKPNVRFIKTSEAMRVLTDYAYDGLYRLPIGDQNNFYRCLNPIIEELTNYKNLYAFTYKDDQGVQVLMVDKYGREYKLISPIELERYTYMGIPISTYYFQPIVSIPGLFETNLQEAETQTMGSIGPEISKIAIQGSVAPTSLSGTERPPIKLRVHDCDNTYGYCDYGCKNAYGYNAYGWDGGYGCDNAYDYNAHGCDGAYGCDDANGYDGNAYGLMVVIRLMVTMKLPDTQGELCKEPVQEQEISNLDTPKFVDLDEQSSQHSEVCDLKPYTDEEDSELMQLLDKDLEDFRPSLCHDVKPREVINAIESTEVFNAIEPREVSDIIDSSGLLVLLEELVSSNESVYSLLTFSMMKNLDPLPYDPRGVVDPLQVYGPALPFDPEGSTSFLPEGFYNFDDLHLNINRMIQGDAFESLCTLTLFLCHGI